MITSKMNGKILSYLLGCAVAWLLPLAAGYASSFDQYYPPYDDIASYLLDISIDIASSYVIGQSSDSPSRDIVALKISNQPDVRQDKLGFLFVGCIHGNEALGVQATLQLIERFLDDYLTDPFVADSVDAYEFWFVPVLNPYGYDNRQRRNGRVTPGNVDLNRNFDFRWNHGGSTDPTSYEYRGPFAASEPEIQAIMSLVEENRPEFGITFHGGVGDDEGLLFRPWGGSQQPPEWNRIVHIGNIFTQAVADYRFGLPNAVMQQSNLGALGQGPCYLHGDFGMFDYLVEVSDDKWNDAFFWNKDISDYSSTETDRMEAADEYVASYLAGIDGWLDHLLRNVVGPTYAGPGATGHVVDCVTGLPLGADINVVQIDDITGDSSVTTPHDLDYDGDSIADWEFRTADDFFGRYLRLSSAGSRDFVFQMDGYSTINQNINILDNPSGVDLAVMNAALIPDGADPSGSDCLDDPFAYVPEIVTPRQLTYVGLPDSPGTFLLIVRVRQIGMTVAELDYSDFIVTVGVEEAVLTDSTPFAEIEGQYWMIVNAPVQSDVGPFDLSVGVQSSPNTDTMPEIIQYGERIDTANVLTIDNSGSMGSPKIDSALNAAGIYVDLFQSTDQVGLVRYNDIAETLEDCSLNLLTDEHRDELKSALSIPPWPVPDGLTSIGNALLHSLEEELDVYANNYEWVIVLLTDGLNTADPPISAFMEEWESRAGYPCEEGNISECRPKVYTVAIGDDADYSELYQLAVDTGGEYHFADDYVGRRTLQDATTCPDELALELADIYGSVAEEVSRVAEVFSIQGFVPEANMESEVHDVVIDGSAVEAIFTVAWAPWDIYLKPYLALEYMGGEYPEEYTPTLVTSSHSFWRIPDPEPGIWRLTVGYGEVGPVRRLEPIEQCYLLKAAVRSMQVLWTSIDEVATVGSDVALRAVFSDPSSLSSINIQASIVNPNGITYTIQLHDDGEHGDGQGKDGFFGGTFNSATVPGSYRVFFSASATSADNEQISRYRRGAFAIQQKPIGFGSISINNGGATSESLTVYVHLSVSSPFVNDMMVSNSEDFSSANWEQFEPSFEWELEPNEDGLATICVMLQDTFGQIEQSCGTIHVVPSCSEAVPSIRRIWPPNNKMVDIDVREVTDMIGSSSGSPPTITVLLIEQSEPVGKDPFDGAGVGTSTAKVRAQRLGRGPGRLYQITFQAKGQGSMPCTGFVRVCVPHDNGKKKKKKAKQDEDEDCPSHLYDGVAFYDSTIGEE